MFDWPELCVLYSPDIFRFTLIKNLSHGCCFPVSVCSSFLLLRGHRHTFTLSHTLFSFFTPSAPILTLSYYYSFSAPNPNPETCILIFYQHPVVTHVSFGSWNFVHSIRASLPSSSFSTLFDLFRSFTLSLTQKCQASSFKFSPILCKLSLFKFFFGLVSSHRLVIGTNWYSQGFPSAIPCFCFLKVWTLKSNCFLRYGLFFSLIWIPFQPKVPIF